MVITGYEGLAFMQLNQEADKFWITIDEALITANDTGTYNIAISLSDKGPDPKFPNDYEFSIEI